MNEQSHPTEYIVFSCKNCHQYTYAKTTQKGKRCPRCGGNHIMSKVEGKIVKGPTAAMQLVKTLQHEQYPLRKFSSTKKGIILQSDTPTNFIPKFSSDSQLMHLLEKVQEWQSNENIAASEGFPEYMLDYIAKEIESKPEKRATLIRKLSKLEKFTRLSNGNIVVNDS